MADSVSSGTIRGRVVGTDSLLVPGARVVVYLVGPVSPDSMVPPDSTPPDTSSASPFEIVRIDSVPGDTVPPPPGQCGDRGQIVVRTRTNQEGFFRIRGLPPGVYDLRAAEAGGAGTVCGLILRSGER